MTPIMARGVKTMYILNLKTIDGDIVDSKELGNWRDHAREKFAYTRRRLETINTTGTLELIDSLTGTVELTHTQTGTK